MFTLLQSVLDAASKASNYSDTTSPEKPSAASPAKPQVPAHHSHPPRRPHVPMDPVLQAERLRAAQELAALKRAQEEELVLSQTGVWLLCWLLLGITCRTCRNCEPSVAADVVPPRPLTALNILSWPCEGFTGA